MPLLLCLLLKKHDWKFCLLVSPVQTTCLWEFNLVINENCFLRTKSRTIERKKAESTRPFSHLPCFALVFKGFFFFFFARSTQTFTSSKESNMIRSLFFSFHHRCRLSCSRNIDTEEIVLTINPNLAEVLYDPLVILALIWRTINLS